MGSPMRGMGSTKFTNGDQGGGDSKWGPPSTVGVPANLSGVYRTNSVPYLLGFRRGICYSITGTAYDVTLETKVIRFASDFDFIPSIGTFIRATNGFRGQVTDVTIDTSSGEPLTAVTYILLNATDPPTAGGTPFTFSNCQ